MVAWISVRVAVAVGLTMAAGDAVAAPSGTVIAVVQSANIDGETGKKVLQPEAPVFSGDRIETGSVGQAQILFRDNTKLVVGPNSSMIVDAFVFNDDNTAREITIDAVRGAFRFMTGNSRKDAYSIKTPTATIGVRGTEFDIAIEKEGTTRVANFEGMTRICRRDAAGGSSQEGCVDVNEPCSLSVVRPAEANVVRYSNKDVEFRNRQLKYYFRYVQNQSGLLSDFQVNLRQCNFAQLAPDTSLPAPAPGQAPPPPVVAPPVPGPPSAPSFTAPAGPSNDDRHVNDRPEYDHGPPIRP